MIRRLASLLDALPWRIAARKAAMTARLRDVATLDRCQRTAAASKCYQASLPECDDCRGTGERYWHADDCADNLCALNGDEHSCVGQVEPCHCHAGDRLIARRARREAISASLRPAGRMPERAGRSWPFNAGERG